MPLPCVKDGVIWVPFVSWASCSLPSHPPPVPGELHLDVLMTLAKINQHSPAF